MSPSNRFSERLPIYLPYILSTIVLIVVFIIRIRLLNVPLERDEGEFAYIGQLLLKGIPPFTKAYTMKLPGVAIMYAFFMFLFGQTSAGIHTGLLIVNGTCICLVYLLAKKLFDGNTAIYSCASYAVLSLSGSVNGFFAHATHFVVLFALAGFLMLLRSIENQKTSYLFISGLCFGLAVTMKQHAVLLLMYAVLYYMWRAWKKQPGDKKYFLTGSFLFPLGMIIPYALIIFWMVTCGAFTDFWLWTVQYAREYTSSVSLISGWYNFSSFFGEILQLQLLLWLLAGFGCVILCIKKNCSSDKLFVSGFLLFSFFSICPGLYFRAHYFVLLMPAAAIMTGVGVTLSHTMFPSTRTAWFSTFIPAVLFVGAISSSIYLERNAFLTFLPSDVSRAIYGKSPFPEAVQIASYIKNDTFPDDKIAVLGSEPEIFFYADRLSATGHIYMYGLMEDQPYAGRMQQQLIREIEATRPKYIVKVYVDTSWVDTVWKESSIQSIFDWEERYIRAYYDLVGYIDIINPKTTIYLWGKAAAGYSSQTKNFVTVYKRKN